MNINWFQKKIKTNYIRCIYHLKGGFGETMEHTLPRG